MLNKMFPVNQFGQIKVQAKSKSGRYMTLMVPSTMIICPECNGRSTVTLIPDAYPCPACYGKNVIEVVSAEFLAQYPLIDKAMRRYDRETQADAWEAYGERVWGC